MVAKIIKIYSNLQSTQVCGWMDEVFQAQEVMSYVPQKLSCQFLD